MTELHERDRNVVFSVRIATAVVFATNGSHTVWQECGPKKVTFCTKCDPRFMVGAC